MSTLVCQRCAQRTQQGLEREQARIDRLCHRVDSAHNAREAEVSDFDSEVNVNEQVGCLQVAAKKQASEGREYKASPLPTASPTQFRAASLSKWDLKPASASACGHPNPESDTSGRRRQDRWMMGGLKLCR